MSIWINSAKFWKLMAVDDKSNKAAHLKYMMERYLMALQIVGPSRDRIFG